MELPIGVFAIAVATVVYPLLARHAAERNHGAFAHDYRRGLRLILLLNVPAAVGQLRWLNNILRNEKNVTLLVTHDDGLFNRLTQDGVLGGELAV